MVDSDIAVLARSDLRHTTSLINPFHNDVSSFEILTGTSLASI